MRSAGPLLSVIVPVYNTEQYLEKFLSSILNSYFRDFEIIVIDDGSTDLSPEICDRFKNENPDFQISVYHIPNGGLSAVRNRGTLLAKGKYITFCDSDDWIEPELFGSLVSAAEEKQAQAAICGFRYFDEITQQFEYHSDSMLPECLADTVFHFRNCNAVIRGLLDCSTCNKVFLKSFITKHNMHYDEKCHFGEDSRYWAEFFLKADRLTLVKGKFYNYRINQSRQTNCVKAKKNYDSFAETMSYIMNLLKNNGIYTDFKGDFIAYLVLLTTVAYSMVSPERKKGFYNECVQVFKETEKFSFSCEQSFFSRCCILYLYGVIRFLPYHAGKIFLSPLMILQNPVVKKFLRKLCAR